jgi:hypothetical protein
MEKTNTEYYVFAKDADYIRVELDDKYEVGSLVYIGEKCYEIKHITIANASEGKIVLSCDRIE